MNGFKNWLYRMLAKARAGLQRFMMGRYGTDKLNTAILIAGLALCLLAMLIRFPVVNLILTTLSYALMIWAIFRCLSRNTYKRYLENSRYLALLQRLRDRDHRYYHCPRCRQPIRVPAGRGKIAITCPKCKERFIKKT